MVDRVGNGVRLRVRGCGWDSGVDRIQARSGLGYEGAGVGVRLGWGGGGRSGHGWG